METTPKSRLFRFLALSPRERGIFLRGIFLIPVITASVRVFGLKKTQDWLEDGLKRNARAPKKPTLPDTICRMTAAASRFGFIRGNCLSRSLALYYFLHQDGHEAHMCLGGRRQGTSFEAHAWVEIANHPVNDIGNVGEVFAPFVVPR